MKKRDVAVAATIAALGMAAEETMASSELMAPVPGQVNAGAITPVNLRVAQNGIPYQGVEPDQLIVVQGSCICFDQCGVRG